MRHYIVILVVTNVLRESAASIFEAEVSTDGMLRKMMLYSQGKQAWPIIFSDREKETEPYPGLRTLGTGGPF
jgi:hypothetical protein